MYLIYVTERHDTLWLLITQKCTLFITAFLPIGLYLLFCSKHMLDKEQKDLSYVVFIAINRVGKTYMDPDFDCPSDWCKPIAT